MVREIYSLRGIMTGYILNLYGGPTGRYGNVVHTCNCQHWEQMTIPPRKIWGDSVAALEKWVTDQGGGLDPAL